MSAVSPTNVYATLDSRSIGITTAVAGATATHTLTYTTTSLLFVGSIRVSYCSNNPLIDSPCTVPAGLDTSGVNLSSQSGDAPYSVHPNTLLSTNEIILTRSAANSAPSIKQFEFSNIINPTTNGSTYVRVSLYSSADATGPYLDWSGLVFALNDPLLINAYVPPFLWMCHAVTVASDCSTIGVPLADLGELSSLSPTAATSQFAVATNGLGYTATIFGSTMTAGNRTITPLTATSGSIPGTGQFGINLVANTAPSVGANVTGTGTGVAFGQYSLSNQFRFVSGEVVARSLLPSEWNRFTISYLVNIPSDQSAGRYASTVSVIVTTTF